MKTNLIVNALIAGALFFTACSGDQSDKVEVEEVEKICKYQVTENSVEVKWTAYKHQVRTAVGGGFDSVTVSGFIQGESIMDALKGVNFEIYTNSINSNDADRDKKIKKHFFGTMNTGALIEGNILSIAEAYAKNTGSGEISLTMNDSAKNLPFTWTYEEELFTLKATVDMGDWEALTALDALHKICHALHTGEDGKSILWPDMEVVVSGVIKKNCE